MTSLFGVLLTLFALAIGCLVGRLRGGSWSGVASARMNGSGWLILGITTALVLRVLDPAVPLAWAVVGAIGFVMFGIKNLQITGMIVLLIGIFLNLVPLLSNGAMPVSELALTSVGDVDESGEADVRGIRESSDTAQRFSAFGDVIPVPIVKTVVSIGDLIVLVALADIAANLFLRARVRERDDAGISFTSSSRTERVAVRSPLNHSGRPAHAAHRRPRKKAAPSTHVPAHAATPVTDEDVIVLDGPVGYIEQPPPPSEADVAGVEPTPIPSDSGDAFASPTEVIDLTDPADHRPIIDLTSSPSDEQLREFLRRRAAADAQLDQAPAPAGSRRGRAPRRGRKHDFAGGVAEPTR